MLKKVVLFLLAGSYLSGAVLAPDLAEKLQTAQPTDRFQVYILPQEQPDYAHLADQFSTKKMLVDYLKDLAARTQAPILNFLSQAPSDEVISYQSYWVANVISAEVTASMLEKLALRSDVLYIEEVPKVRILVASANPDASEVIANPTPEWNISRVNADTVWALGYDGSGIIIGQMDTGVFANHPAFHNRFAGYWHDFCNGVPTPYDDNSHGTHTMGTAVGGDGLGPDVNDIGVAPGAQFTAVKVFDGTGNACNIMSGFQWYASLVGDSGVPVRVINNSWGSNTSSSLAYWSAVLTWRALDIIPVFAIGNSGPGSGSANTPGNYPTVIGVGATDSGDNIASFSSRGPAPNMSPWNDPQYWPRPDWNLIKPDISAPGVNIRSSVPGGGYQGGYLWSGTSMATPHVTGAVAVLLSKNPFMDFETIYNILTESAYQPPQGGTFPNNNYGWGRLDLLAALNMVPVPTLPYITLVGYQISAGGDDQLDPGESGEIVVTLTNLADSTAYGATATLRTNSPYITLLDSTYAFGDIASGDTVDNAASPFTLQVDANAPSGEQIQFTVHFVSNNGDYTTDLDFTTYIGVPRADYLDVHAGNATLTVTDRGAIGFMHSDQAQGSGFVYPANGQNTLYYGTFAIGNSSSYVADAWYESGGLDDEDFQPTSNPNGQLYYFTPTNGATEGVWGMFEDSGHPNPQGITVEMEAYAWDDPTYDDFVIVLYTITATQDVSNLYVGYFMDFDIGATTYDQNMGGTDATTRTAYLNYGTTYVGVTLLNPPTPANLSVINNPTYVYPNQGMPDNTQWLFLNGTYSFPTASVPDDWSVMASAGPFNLTAGQDLQVAFAVVGGTSLSALLQNAQNAISLFNATQTEENGTLPVPFTVYRFAPNPTRGQTLVEFGLPYATEVQIGLYDVTGRQLHTYPLGLLKPGIHRETLDLSSYPEGLYFIRIKAGEAVRVRPILKVQ